MNLFKALVLIVSPLGIPGQNSRGDGRKLNFKSRDPVQSLVVPGSITEDFEDYLYYAEDQLPSGPTRPTPIEPDYYFYEEDILPSGPTREPPLPSGPTRKPGQATTISPGVKATSVHPALSQLLTLPLLTTPRPRAQKRNRGEKKKKGLLGRKGGFVSGKIDIVDQTKIFSAKDPFQEQFIAPPPINAGALPLAIDTIPSGNQFPPFNIE